MPSEVPEDAVKNTGMWLEKGPYRGRQLDTGVNIVAVVPGEKHNTGQHKDRNEVTKWIWTVGGGSRPPKIPEISNPVSERSERTDCI